MTLWACTPCLSAACKTEAESAAGCALGRSILLHRADVHSPPPPRKQTRKVTLAGSGRGGREGRSWGAADGLHPPWIWFKPQLSCGSFTPPQSPGHPSLPKAVATQATPAATSLSHPRTSRLRGHLASLFHLHPHQASICPPVPEATPTWAGGREHCCWIPQTQGPVSLGSHPDPSQAVTSPGDMPQAPRTQPLCPWLSPGLRVRITREVLYMPGPRLHPGPKESELSGDSQPSSSPALGRCMTARGPLTVPHPCVHPQCLLKPHGERDLPAQPPVAMERAGDCRRPCREPPAGQSQTQSPLPRPDPREPPPPASPTRLRAWPGTFLPGRGGRPHEVGGHWGARFIHHSMWLQGSALSPPQAWCGQGR